LRTAHASANNNEESAGDARFLQEGRDSMKALLIDDHPLILSALRAVIEGLGTDVRVTGVASAQTARAALIEDSTFDLVLLDLQLGDADGFDLLAELRGSYPALPVVVVSASERSDDVLHAIDLGAMGFVPKCASNDTLFEALHLVMSGGIYLPPAIMRGHAATRAAAARAEQGSRPAGGPAAGAWGLRLEAAAAASPTPAASLAPLGLTPRQTDVLALLLKGLPNKLIARELHLSVETVKDHVAAVLRSLNVSSRTQAVLAVSRMSHEAALSAWREERAGHGRNGVPVARHG
jgi:DNA-binding NarL/FixJ family response regulator